MPPRRAIALIIAAAWWKKAHPSAHEERVEKVQAQTVAAVATTQVELNEAVDHLADSVTTNIRNTDERTARHVAAIRATPPQPAPPGVRAVVYDDGPFLNGVCPSRFYARDALCERRGGRSAGDHP